MTESCVTDYPHLFPQNRTPWLEKITSKPGSLTPFLWSWISGSFPDIFTDCHWTYIIPGKAQGFPATTELRCANKQLHADCVHGSTVLCSSGPLPFWAPGTGFMQDNFSTDQGRAGGWFGDESSA